MDAAKILKVLKIVILALMIVQIPWFIAVQLIVNRTQTKTTATVISVQKFSSGCTYGRNRLCDGSDKLIPVYEYFDSQGMKHEVDDRFFGEFKQNNPLRFIFGKNVGDKVTAYYTKDKPQEVLFMTGPLAYTAWLIPLYAGVVLLVPFVVLFLYKKFTTSNK